MTSYLSLFRPRFCVLVGYGWFITVGLRLPPRDATIGFWECVAFLAYLGGFLGISPGREEGLGEIVL